MMKTSLSNNTFGAVVAMLIGAAFLAPSLSIVHTPPVSAQNDICGRLVQFQSVLESRFAERAARLQASWTERDRKLKEAQQAHDTQRAARALVWEKRRNAHGKKMEARTETPAQQKAVAAFEKVIIGAQEKRRATVAAINSSFRSGLQQVIKDRTAQAIKITGAFEASLKSIFSKTGDECAQGADAVTVRTNLVLNFKGARENFEADRADLEKPHTALDQLVSIKKDAIEKAIQDFQIVITKAHESLLAEFPETELKN